MSLERGWVGHTHLCSGSEQAAAVLCLPQDTQQSLEGWAPALSCSCVSWPWKRCTPTLAPQLVRGIGTKANTSNAFNALESGSCLRIRLVMTQYFQKTLTHFKCLNMSLPDHFGKPSKNAILYIILITEIIKYRDMFSDKPVFYIFALNSSFTFRCLHMHIFTL